MGMFDYVKCEAPLPPGSGVVQDEEFQTKDFDWPYLDTYRITKDGRLVREEYREDEVPETERPYWGTEHWPGMAAVGMIRRVALEDRDLEFHGQLRFYTYLQDVENWFEFTAKFTDGKLVEIKRIDEPERERAG